LRSTPKKRRHPETPNPRAALIAGQEPGRVRALAPRSGGFLTARPHKRAKRPSSLLDVMLAPEVPWYVPVQKSEVLGHWPGACHSVPPAYSTHHQFAIPCRRIYFSPTQNQRLTNFFSSIFLFIFRPHPPANPHESLWRTPTPKCQAKRGAANDTPMCFQNASPHPTMDSMNSYIATNPVAERAACGLSPRSGDGSIARPHKCAKRLLVNHAGYCSRSAKAFAERKLQVVRFQLRTAPVRQGSSRVVKGRQGSSRTVKDRQGPSRTVKDRQGHAGNQCESK